MTERLSKPLERDYIYFHNWISEYWPGHFHRWHTVLVAHLSCVHSLHSPDTLLGTPYQYQVRPSFAFRTALILHGIDPTRCWKHSSEILVRIYMTASYCCCRFVGCTSMMGIFCSSTSQRCLVGLRPGDYGDRWSTVSSVSEDGYTSHKGMDMVSIR